MSKVCVPKVFVVISLLNPMVFILYRIAPFCWITRRSINCTYFGIPLYGMEEEISNVTTYELLSVNRQYFVRDMNMTTTLRCTDCTCNFYAGTSTSRQFWTLFFIFVIIVVVISAIDCLIKVIQRGRKKKE